jgi:hypothetical protein
MRRRRTTRRVVKTALILKALQRLHRRAEKHPKKH